MNYDDLSLEYLMESTTPDTPVTLGSLMTAVRAMAATDNEALLELVSAGNLDSVFPYTISLPEKAPELERWDEVIQQGDAPQPKQDYHSTGLFRSLVGNNQKIRLVRKQIEQVSDSNACVLIQGESGTGKEVVARNIHYHSERRGKPFVSINCGAIPSELLESELFGHEKGAFAGAISARKGRIELAEGSTLFLVDIDEMNMHVQMKLMRVLQERTFDRVGSNTTIESNVRIVAATHRNLEEAIVGGKFREDLFHRLNVFPIDMPPLRERIEDIPLLVNELVKRLKHEKRGTVRLTPAAVVTLCQYHWPGNVRELANMVERLVITHPYGMVDVHDLPQKFQIEGDTDVSALSAAIQENTIYDTAPVAATASIDLLETPRLPQDGIDLKEHLSNMEYNLIKQALDDADGVVSHAANRLRLRRSILVEKLHKHDLLLANNSSKK